MLINIPIKNFQRSVLNVFKTFHFLISPFVKKYQKFTDWMEGWAGKPADMLSSKQKLKYNILTLKSPTGPASDYFIKHSLGSKQSGQWQPSPFRRCLQSSCPETGNMPERHRGQGFDPGFPTPGRHPSKHTTGPDLTEGSEWLAIHLAFLPAVWRSYKCKLWTPSSRVRHLISWTKTGNCIEQGNHEWYLKPPES